MDRSAVNGVFKLLRLRQTSLSGRAGDNCQARETVAGDYESNIFAC
jgi:hypothetical protein